MCQFKSAIVTRTGEVLHHWGVDSHEDLIDLFGLRDNNHLQHFVRVEYCPDTTENLRNPQSYELMVDEKQTPEWFEEKREAVTATLAALIERSIIRENKKILVGGDFILIGNVRVERIQNARVIGCWENSRVGELRGNSRVGELRGNSRVGELRENSRVGELRENSQVVKNYSSKSLPKPEVSR